MGVEPRFYCKECGQQFGKDELDTYENSDGYPELVHKACGYNNFETLPEAPTLVVSRWADTGDIERCKSLAQHFSKHWGPEATLDQFIRWCEEHRNGYTWEE